MAQQPGKQNCVTLNDAHDLTLLSQRQKGSMVSSIICDFIIIIIIINEYYYGGAVALLLQDHLTMSLSRFAD